MIFFFNDTAPTEIYTLSLPDALPVSTAGILADSGVSQQCIGGCFDFKVTGVGAGGQAEIGRAHV